MSTPLTEKQAKCLELIESVPFVDLTTLDQEGFPSSRVMANLRDKAQFAAFSLYEAEKNPLAVFLMTHQSSDKIAEIQKNPKASLYFYSPALFSGVSLSGRIEIVADEALRKKAWQDDWKTYYPNGASDFALLRFVPLKLKACLKSSQIAETL